MAGVMTRLAGEGTARESHLCGQGGEELQIPAGRCCSVVSPTPIWTWGHDKQSSSSGKKHQFDLENKD